MRKSRFAACRWGLLVLFGVAGGLGSPAQAETLRWRFKPGETLRWVMDKKEVYTEVKDERETKTTVTQTTNMSWTVKSVADDGSAQLTLKIDRVVAENRTPYGVFKYDSSAKQAAANPTEAAMQDLMKAAVGAEFSSKISATGELTDVRLPDQLTKALTEQKKDGEPEGNTPLSDENLKKMFTSMSLPLPREDLAPGKTWTRQDKFPTPPAGSVTIDTTFRFRGPDPQAGANVVRIDHDARFTPELTANNEFKITIKSQELTGSIFFDTAAGRIVKFTVIEKDERRISFQGMESDLSKNTTSSFTLAR